MPVSAVKFTVAWLGLFALLKFGWAQDIWNDSQVNGAHVSNTGSSFLTKTGYIRRRRATASEVTSSCLTLPQPVNGHYKLERYFCDDITDCEVSEGTLLEPGSQLVYRCNPGYRAEGNTDVYCRARGKWSAIPNCTEVKCEPLSSVSTTVSCSRFGNGVDCNFPVLPETRAEVTCRHGYKKDTDFVTIRRGVVTCDAHGKWDPQPIRCIPVCGVAITHQQPFVFGGTTAKVGDFPWHASLFLQIKSSTNNEKVFLCGATIIQTNLLMTAAHCVYDERTKTTRDPEKLFVITGNIFRDYDSPVHNPDVVRKAAVKNVYTSCNYYGLIGNYVSDIGLLELEHPFEFSSILLPACLDDSEYRDQFLEPGVYGRVAGFGRTNTGTTSGILQTITVPYVSYSQCRASNNGVQNEAFISSDKFCAGYNNGSGVCEGDSGGGLVVKKGDLWYVMGIVSVGLGVDIDNGEKTCDKFSYSLYTKVSIYMTWIQDVLLYVERRRRYPSCSHHSQTSTSTSATSTTTSRPTTTTARAPTFTISSNPYTCSVPPQPANGERKLHEDDCEDKMECDVLVGTEVDSGSRLVYRCAPGFTTEGITDIYCLASGEWTPLPTCTGDSCTLINGSPGGCTRLKDCPPVLEELKAGKSPDTQCGFSGAEPIVCCPMSPPMTTTTSIPVVTEKPVSDGRGSIARKKCMEYSQHDDASTCPPPLPIDNDLQPVNVSATTGKIKSRPMEFPHMAAIGFVLALNEIGWYCGGTLISENFVMTTAACSVTRSFGNAAWARVGDFNLVRSDDGATPVDRRIAERIIYPDFKPGVEYHDIALLRLESPVSFNSWIRPACLRTTPTVGIQEAIATGWGRVEWLDDKGSDDLMKVTLPLVDHQTCNAKWGSDKPTRKLPNGIVEDWLICAGGPGKDTCQGDSGGPLVIHRGDSMKQRCMYDIIGITSLGRACGSGFPGLYTRVYHYIPWIESIVWGRG